jgi:hypothetical protein
MNAAKTRRCEEYEELDLEIESQNLEEMFKSRRSTLMILPSVSRLVLRTAQKLDGCWIAGGAALGLFTGDVNKIKDWDLFFKSPGYWNQAKSVFENLGFVETRNSGWSVTFSKAGVDVQLVTRHYYKQFEDIFKKFDFSVCCFAIVGEDICYYKQAKVDVGNGKLNFIHTENIATCVKRIARYGAKGYTPSDAFVEGIAKTFKNTKLSDLKKMRENGSPEES